MLLQIRDYIAREGMVTTQQLSRSFGVDRAALQPMLDVWVRKGVIQPGQEASNCQSTCFKCSKQVPEYYCYVDLPETNKLG